MKYKLILSDLDGTLLRSDKTVSTRTVRALEKARSRGVLFAAATGRLFDGMPRCVREIAAMEYAITVNGAKILKVNPRQVLNAAEIPLDTARELISYFEGLPVIYDCYYRDEAFMPEKFLQDLPGYLSERQREMILSIRKPVSDLSAFLKTRGGTVEKVQCFFPDSALQARVKAQLADQ